MRNYLFVLFVFTLLGCAEDGNLIQTDGGVSADGGLCINGELCRGKTGPCDLPSTCIAGVCPANAFVAAGTACSMPDGDVGACSGRDSSCHPASPVQTDGGCPAQSDGGICCPSGKSICGSACVDLKTDNGNCGSCGFTCTNGAECKLGSCRCDNDPSAPTACNVPGHANVVYCVNTSFDPYNCGACGNICASGMCANGTCQGVPTGVCYGKPSGYLCRAAATDCDVAEYCDGVSNDCPSDKFATIGTQCHVVGDGTGTCSGSDTTCRAPGNKCIGVSCPGGYYCDPVTGNCVLPGQFTCHGTVAIYAQADITAAGVSCTGYGVVDPVASLVPATTTVGLTGVCSIVCVRADGSKIAPVACGGVWAAGGTSDTAHWQTSKGCCRLPGHPAGEADTPGCAWDHLILGRNPASTSLSDFDRCDKWCS